ncbi:ferredoxin-type protein NapF [Marinobacter sp. ATCH36]|uniref:ferredoxin-type protein NapF n=1 Tax=Marinobacter sp. ATCH36 TaxID=2945106 RepID=UPI0020214B7E|nr:ferredoxin-type protein NapF [Marinobacter sp. ATCH36]MCL7944245.1 ferredoxin-type protein NapF [Marinobacter sp. ATCH36]
MAVSLARRAFLRSGKPLASEHRPPWTGEDFVDACVRCGDCINACPEGILQKGDGGFPQIHFNHDGCTFCQECVHACDEPVFDLARDAFQWRAGIRDNCLAKAGIHCQSCQDACDTEAISFRYSVGQVPRPEVDAGSCTGCGACVAVCPQDAIDLVVPEHERVNEQTVITDKG